MSEIPAEVPSRKRVTLVGSSLVAGGAERVMTILANAWAERFDVTIITLASARDDFYQVRSQVRRIGLEVTGDSAGLLHALQMNRGRIRRLESAIREVHTDVVISFLMQVNVVAIAAARRAGVPVIVSERIDPTQHRDPFVWRILRRLTYPFANAVVAQTSNVGNWLQGIVPAGRVDVIPNPVQPMGQSMKAPGALPTSRPYIAAMGRLTRQKGFDLLLTAFAASVSSLRYDLVIIGEGPDRSSLSQKVRVLGLDGKAHLVGQVQDPAGILQASALFVLSSRYEGFPNALLEAMSLGVPAVAFDCPSGVSDIVRDGVDGLLVEVNDSSALAAAIDALLSDEAQRSRMALAAREVLERFSLSSVLTAWERCMQRVANTP